MQCTKRYRPRKQLHKHCTYSSGCFELALGWIPMRVEKVGRGVEDMTDRRVHEGSTVSLPKTLYPHILMMEVAKDGIAAMSPTVWRRRKSVASLLKDR
jgi:hypothetical protein